MSVSVEQEMEREVHASLQREFDRKAWVVVGWAALGMFLGFVAVWALNNLGGMQGFLVLWVGSIVCWSNVFLAVRNCVQPYKWLREMNREISGK